MSTSLQAGARSLALAALLGLLGACAETPQEPAKTYAGKEDTKPYSSDAFKGDKQKWEATLATRAANQNEYLRTGAAKP